MLNDNDRGAVIQQRLEHAQQHPHIQRMQTDAGLVEYEYRVRLRAANLAGQLEPLRLAARQAGRFLAQCQIAQAQMFQHLQALADRFHIMAKRNGRAYVHVHQLGQGNHLPRLAAQLYIVGSARIARAAAIGTGNVHIGQKLHVQTDHARAVAAGTAQIARVVRKIAGFEAVRPGVRRFGV